MRKPAVTLKRGARRSIECRLFDRAASRDDLGAKRFRWPRVESIKEHQETRAP